MANNKSSGALTPQNGSLAKLPPLTEDTVRQIVEQQAREQVLKGQELALRGKELEFQSKHASEALGAQERDRELQRQHERSREKNKLMFMGVIALALIVFACVGLFMNKDAIVRDIVQIVLSGVVGAAGGYGYAKRDARDEPGKSGSGSKDP